jgi:hypothetical protein
LFFNRHERVIFAEFQSRLASSEIAIVPTVYIGAQALSIQDAMQLLSESHYGALDPVEGAIWRIERDDKVEFLVKYVRPDKVDGIYLPEVTGNGRTVWNHTALTV